jgi:hypothetical protein
MAQTAGSSCGSSATGLLTAPTWVKLVRFGDNFTAYFFGDGEAWLFQGSSAISMAATVYTGFAITSYNDHWLCSGWLDSIII